MPVHVIEIHKNKETGMKLSTVLLMGIGAVICSQVGMAEAKYGMAGCGLGSLVVQSHSNMSHIFAATTNGTS